MQAKFQRGLATTFRTATVLFFYRLLLDGNWGSFQLANGAPPLSVTDSAIAPLALGPKDGDFDSVPVD